MLAVVITQLLLVLPDGSMHFTLISSLRALTPLGPRRDKSKLDGVIMSESSVISGKIAKSDYKLSHVFLPVCLSVRPSA